MSTLDNSLNAYVLGRSPYEPILPFVHMTDVFVLSRIAATEQLEPTECPVFKEPLLYLFCGRPSYRPNSKDLPSSLGSMAPVCFVLRPEALASVARVFPFDSGAFQAGLFNDFLHSKM